MTTSELQIAGIRKPGPRLSARRSGCSLIRIEFSPAFCAVSFRRILDDFNLLLGQALEVIDEADNLRVETGLPNGFLELTCRGFITSRNRWFPDNMHSAEWGIEIHGRE